MPTVHYYGRKTNFLGKTLFEILANLRNFGINRMLLKQEELLKNPGEKCYYIVKKVEPVMDEKLEQGAIYAERVFRNAKVPGLVFVDDESWHADWQLVPKSDEDLYRIEPDNLLEHGDPRTIRVLPRWMEVPPLMDLYLKQCHKLSQGSDIKVSPKSSSIRMHYDLSQMNKPHMLYRVADEGESIESTLNLPIKTLLMDRFRPESTGSKNAGKDS